MNGNDVKELRRILDLTQEEFAARVGFKRSIIAAWETKNTILPEYRERIIRMEFNLPRRVSVIDDQTGDLFQGQ